MDVNSISRALDNLEIGLSKYITIMDLLTKVDVSKDNNFQRLYNGFYRLRQRTPEFYSDYYDFMEKSKNQDICFEEVVYHFNNKFHRIEASFSSKLAATINPNLPIWDSVVMKNLALKKPPNAHKDRLKETVEIYKKICTWYKDFLVTHDARTMVSMFNEKYPYAQITDVKKIDFILWQIR